MTSKYMSVSIKSSIRSWKRRVNCVTRLKVKEGSQALPPPPWSLQAKKGRSE